MSARAKVLFVIFSAALVTGVQALTPDRPDAAETAPGACESLATLSTAWEALPPCQTPWASCFGRDTTFTR